MGKMQHGWLVAIYVDDQPEAVDTEFFTEYEAATEFKHRSLIDIDGAVGASFDEVYFDLDTGEYEAA